MLPKPYVSLFKVERGHGYSKLKVVKEEVSQKSILGPLLYPLSTSVISKMKDISLTTITEDAAMTRNEGNPVKASQNFQNATDKSQCGSRNGNTN